ncbi:transcription factor EMB1444-like isoform X2 [Vicia villosa]|uniref:transcription factor EMB1444-like isoform X2 n=1 Tax=Vicia villosa TaxID=3911 RepID=UPI00273ACAF3|nr:transcription factor EMB1444-like isoform X2 [Vicia villosa]
MGSNLHQLLRSLCFNTHWNYAIFWKLKHCAPNPMILTLEDAYCDNSDYFDASENKTLEQIKGGKFSHEALGLAVAKMSYNVYSLGEGVVGQVAVTGKHRWICADDQVTSSDLSFEFTDLWQTQFSAGIRTIVVVSVVPLGVVQLGSLIKVNEDMGVINHIRNLFLFTQDYSIDHIPSQIQHSLKSSSSHDILMEKSSSDIMPACMTNETVDVLMPLQCSGRNSATNSAYWEMGDDVIKHEIPELNSDVSPILLQSTFDMINVKHQEFGEIRPLSARECAGGSDGHKNMRLESEQNLSSFLNNSLINNDGVSDLIHHSEKSRVDSACFPTDFLEAYVSESDKSHKHCKKSEFWTVPCGKDTSYTQLSFPAGCELHEALGPASLKGSKYLDSLAQVNQDVKIMDMPDTVNTSQSTPEHLLEAMVANICHSSNNDVNSESSFYRSKQSAISSGKKPEVSIQNVTVNPESYSIDHPSLFREEKHHCLSSSSGVCGVMSSQGISSLCPSACSEQLERSSEPSKNIKKRARPGESCRPRPRDRQLIQDRIKELRELVPNGAKCSIDSLLERSIKHMLFLQSITKHADKLTKFADSKSKLHHVEADILGSSSSEQGSSWAMEVGGHLKVHSILVENLSKNGQMLVEMLCEEWSHFLEIAEAIRSLGLTIVKGATKTRDDKMLICFIVEVENNKNVHRLDILWPLVQILQSKSTAATVTG